MRAPQAKNFHFPPPAKADIATAILTNVIEHLVLLLPPNKHAVLYTFVARKPVENIMFDNASNSLISQPLKIPLFTVFSSIFPCSNTGSQVQHIYKKSLQNIVFDSVFPMFPVKQTVIYTFFAIKAVNPSKTLLLTVFL